MAEPNWTSIANLPTGGTNWVPHVEQAGDKHLEVFTLDSHGAVWHTTQIAPNGHWNPWALVANPPEKQMGADCQLEITATADGLFEIFTFDSQGGLWNIWQTSSKGKWSPWDALDNPFGSRHQSANMFKVARNVDDHLELFTVDNDGALWHCWQLEPGGEWSIWASLAHPPDLQLAGSPIVATKGDGRLEIFSYDREGGLWHIWQSSSTAGWSDWTALGNPYAGAARDRFNASVIRDADGRLELFASGKDAIQHIWQVAPNGTWSSWDTLPDPSGVQLTGKPLVENSSDGRLEVFSSDSQGAYWHTSKKASGGSWSTWTKVDLPEGVSVQGSYLTKGQEADGRLVLLLRDSNGVLWFTS